jgi:hypothetical protein
MSAEATPTPVNPYSAPQARVADMDLATDGLFYVVAPRKFLIMMIGTCFCYGLYWFYKNWTLLNRNRSYWPVMRAIFAIFFTHALFREVDAALKRQNRPEPYQWSPGALATTYVVSALASSLLGQLVSHDIAAQPLSFISWLLGVPIVYCLYRAQDAINAAENDPAGLQNNSLTLANFAWLAVGVLFWAITIWSWYVILTGRLPRPGQ